MLTLLHGDCRKVLPTIPEKVFRCCVSSPPYWGLRDYKHPDQIGMEKTPQEYIANLTEVFREMRRALTDDGTLWLNLGDSYATGAGSGRSMGGKVFGKQNQVIDGGAYPRCQPNRMRQDGLKAKDLVGIPWRVAFALQKAGWWLRSDIIWAKPNPMPESVTDRPTRSHEYLFLLAKSEKYFYDAEAIKEPGQSGADGHGGAASRKSRAHEGAKNFPNGERNGMRPDKQRGHSRRHDGFNDRWDQMERDEQCSGMRNKRDVWTVPPANYAEAHFATFPPALIQPCILAGSAPGDAVLDPFGGSGTTGKVAIELGRRCTLIELNADYLELARQRGSTTVGFGF